VLGSAFGTLGWHVVRSRRRIALRNLELCLPELPAAEREHLAREHFRWLGRSLLERGLLWYASPARLRRLIGVEGDAGLADRSDKPVMWLAPHFMALDVAGASVLLFQTKKGISIYQRQSDPVLDRALRRGRLRLGNATKCLGVDWLGDGRRMQGRRTECANGGIARAPEVRSKQDQTGDNRYGHEHDKYDPATGHLRRLLEKGTSAPTCSRM